MSANRLKHAQSGFTLIEVTLAIVIGVVVIAGATVLYNQAKASAANTAAQSKVSAAAAMIEEFAAKNFGRYPEVTGDQFQKLWQRTREDYSASPWGGPTGHASGSIAAALAANVGEVSTETAGSVGVIEYRKAANTQLYTVYDRQVLNDKEVRNYAVWIWDGKGMGPNFVMGGR